MQSTNHNAEFPYTFVSFLGQRMVNGKFWQYVAEKLVFSPNFISSKSTSSFSAYK